MMTAAMLAPASPNPAAARRATRSPFGLVTALAAGLLLAGAGGGARAEAPPQRIVAAGGVITEIIYALGRQDRLVGVDSTSLHPPEALRAKRGIGYVRALSAEGVLSLNPDLVLAVEGAGPPDALKLLRQAGVPMTMIAEDLSEGGVAARIRAVGAAIDAAAEAEALAARVDRDLAALAAERAAIPVRKRVLFVLSLQNGRVLAGGRNTAAAAMIALAGAHNAADSIEGYKPISDEGLIAAAPEVIVMMKTGDHAIGAEDLFARPSFKALPAAGPRALVTMDGLYLLGFGPRTPDAARDLMRAIAAFGPDAGRRTTAP
ncbi:heme/hemin ABC transporter substrate-binding protein [Rhabdaerophilum calidifontis]|uniref:heme/hemin ABC transporter substrate-binding protein n=1 Tax=Rhabdaerophilum calidifontis TaxID=2604328 RepID=UPI001FE81326|nr:ABC transporter substrate-binding protein [Rhabdaerophilum calidifontis]